jgi:hypothetical protein
MLSALIVPIIWSHYVLVTFINIQQLNHDQSSSLPVCEAFLDNQPVSFQNPMSSEETPLLIEQRNHNAVYNRFTRRQKRVIVAVVSWEAPRSSPISLSGRNPQNRPQIRYNLSLKSAIPDKPITCHRCDLAKCVTRFEKKFAGNAYRSPSPSRTANKIYSSLPYVYKSTITGICGFRTISSLCFESPASCLPEFSTSVKSSTQLVL